MVSTARLLGAGITEDEIRTRARRGSLIRVHPGVYRVGHLAPSLPAAYLAAVLACGDGAVLSGLAAAYLWELIGECPPAEVSAPAERRVAGVITHRRRTLAARDRTTRNGVPVTTVPRTLVDLAGRLSLADLATACHNANVLYRTTPRHVEKVLERHRNAAGRANLMLVMSGGVPVSLTKLESRFLRRLREADLPLPDETNKYADEHRVDCRWTTRQLTVELDSYRFHNSRRSWQKDRDRERAAYARGDQHRRYTWHDVSEDPRAMLRELTPLLAPGLAV